MREEEALSDKSPGPISKTQEHPTPTGDVNQAWYISSTAENILVSVADESADRKLALRGEEG